MKKHGQMVNMDMVRKQMCEILGTTNSGAMATNVTSMK
jgi:hypothetical protein